MIDEHLEYLRELLPKYLTPEEGESLFSSIKNDFPFSNDPYKLYRELTDISTFYQGDAILDIPFPTLDFELGDFKLENYTGAVLSNTCDIAAENARDYIPNILFGAIYPLKQFLDFLEKTNVPDHKIKKFEGNVRENNITSLFYLPELIQGGKTIIEESIVRFDHTTSIPISFFTEERYSKDYLRNGGDRLFTFSNYGFYLFIFKLSLHFCRFKEGVFRN